MMIYLGGMNIVAPVLGFVWEMGNVKNIEWVHYSIIKIIKLLLERNTFYGFYQKVLSQSYAEFLFSVMHFIAFLTHTLYI